MPQLVMTFVHLVSPQSATVGDSVEGRYISHLKNIICASIFTEMYLGVPVPLINEVATIWLASRVVHTLLYVYGASTAVGGMRGIVGVWAGVLHILNTCKVNSGDLNRGSMRFALTPQYPSGLTPHYCCSTLFM